MRRAVVHCVRIVQMDQFVGRLVELVMVMARVLASIQLVVAKRWAWLR